MDIQVGDRITYKDNNGKICIIIIKEDKGELGDEDNTIKEILKIERPEYKLIEEKKELLTEEEKEFLKTISKIKYDGISYIEKANGQLIVQGSMTYQTNYIITDKFNGLTENERYTLEELRLN